MPTDKSDELYRVLKEKGFHEDLCREIAYKHMTTDYTAMRMLGYLYNHESPSVELVVDEMIAILEDRERFRQKHEAEEANAAVTRLYREGLGE